MSDKKISQFNELTTAAAADLIPIVDVATSETKFIQKQNLIPDAGLIKDIVFKYDVDTVLEIGKINWVAPTANHTMSVPTADVGNLGEVLIVNNRSVYSLTITGVVVTPLILNGVNSIVGLVCVTDGVSYGWEVFSRYNIGDFDLISQTITNGVTTKAPSEDAVFDALALKADLASPTFTGTVTTPDVIVSGATALTIAHFDVTKNIESLPTATYPSLPELSYVKGVTSAIQTQINARSTAYAIPNYYRVDLNLGDDLTGVAGREDKPYRLIQTVWDLIPTSSTAQITIEIVGDFTFTTHAILTSVNKDNITFLFKGKIVYAVPASTTSRPLFTFTGTNNNLTFIVPNYTQTTQGGFIYAPTASSGYRFIFDNAQILLGVNTSTVNNWGFRVGGGTGEGYFICNNLTVSLANDASGIVGYTLPISLGNINIKVTSLKLTGTPTLSTILYGLFSGSPKSITIDNLSADNGYTNLTNFGITYNITCDNIFVNNINVASNGSTQKSIAYALFKLSSCKNLTIMSGSILNYGMITTAQSELENLNLGDLSMNGVIGNTSNPFTKNLNLLGNITKTVASQSADKFLIWIGAGAIINGNGFKIIHTDSTYIATTAIIMISGSASPKATFINNLTIYNSNMITNNANPAFVPIYYIDTTTKIVRFRNLVISSSNDAHTHANTTFMRPYNANTSYTCRIEGNVATNYLQNITNLTNDADIDLINGYLL